ncbi:MAG: glycosyltransferase family 2 protein [Pseudomonadota bacterium]
MTGARNTASVPISVVIPTRNASADLAHCLAALTRFDDVVVVDSGSTDDTQAIAQRFGARLITFRWNGRYPKKRNWTLANHSLAHPWVLFLDADEVVDERFVEEAAAAVTGGDADGYWLSYTNHFNGRPLRFGVPQRKLALFRVSRGAYERIDEQRWSALDMEVHEHPIIDGPVGALTTPIAHRDRSGLSEFLKRHVAYAEWEAARWCALHSSGSSSNARARQTGRQAFKYRHLHRWWLAPAYFLYATVLRLGILDGAPGLLYAGYKAWYFATVRQLIHERWRAEAETRAAEGARASAQTAGMDTINA